SYPGVSRGVHFQEANEALLTAMEDDPQFAQMMQEAGVNLERTATGFAPRTPPAGWIWHHAEDPGVMQLVPRAQHTPGSIAPVRRFVSRRKSRARGDETHCLARMRELENPVVEQEWYLARYEVDRAGSQRSAG